jgi:hypothetical protein
MSKAITSDGENMSEIQSLTIRASDLGNSVDRWNSAMIWALVLGAIAAVAIVLTTRIVVVKAKQLAHVQSELLRAKDKQLTLDLKDKDEKIAEAGRIAGSANERAAAANERAANAQESLALAEQHAAEANAKAEGFRLDIATANESSKQAEARALEANLELARFKAPRTLSQSQQANIAGRLRPFGPKRLDVIIIGDAKEIVDITGSIVAAIQQAGWNVNVVGKAISGPNVSGVLVGTHLGSDGNIIAASEVLISALQLEGIVTGRFTPQFDDTLPMAIMGKWDTTNVAPIRMLVSAKP